MPNLDILREWATVLESDQYHQGTGRLRSSDDDYCCLGVLCDIVKEQVDGRWIDNGNGYDFYTYHGVSFALLPSAVRELVGIGSAGDIDIGEPTAPYMTFYQYSFGDRTYHNLDSPNDEGRSFAEIAAAIRTYIATQEVASESSSS